jgi:hypothetical protein
MAQTKKASAGSLTRRSARKRGRSRGKVGNLAYALADAVAEEFVVKHPPAGVKVAFVATTPAAEKKLRNWAAVKEKGRGKWVIYQHSAARPRAEAKIETTAYDPSSRARALLQGHKLAEADLKEAGGAFDLEQVRTLLNGVSRQAIEKRVKEGSLLVVPGPSNRRRYPTAQFTRDGVVLGLKEVQEALPTRNPWAVLNFFVRPDDQLGGRKPIDVLRQGDVELVVSAARGMGVQGG